MRLSYNLKSETLISLVKLQHEAVAFYCPTNESSLQF
jgi:hypothetical protein